MSYLSRFDLSFDSPKKPLPPLSESSSLDDSLDNLSKEICALDPEFAEILLSLTFSTESRDEKIAKLRGWAGV
ncbi:MAG: hypothetical protein ACI8XO_002580 [Verrucomicrobiales bacterium]|jgi:hypothetical protein